MSLDEHLSRELSRELSTRGDRARADLDAYARTRVTVALIGETGSGKSSLINAIVGRKVATTGGTGETTRRAQEVAHEGVDGLVFADLPGCGTPNHPRETYVQRQGLLEKYDVFVLVTDKRVRQGDEWLYRTLAVEHKRPFFVVRTHLDQVVDDELSEAEARKRITADVRKQLGAGAELKPYVVALKGPERYDLARLVEDIIDALDGWKRERVALAVAVSSEAVRRKKRTAAEALVGRYALASAANGLNPIPGLDVSIDVGLLSAMAGEVVSAYGLRDDQLDAAAEKNLARAAMGAIRFAARPAAEYLTREVILLVLKRLGPAIATKSVSRYVPFVGQVVAAYLGYRLTSYFGEKLIDDCEAAARAVDEVMARRRN